VSGETKVTLNGYFAADARSKFRYLNKDSEDQFVKAVDQAARLITVDWEADYS